MEIAKIRKLTPHELAGEIEKARQRAVELQSEVAMHRVKNWRTLNETKRYLARLLTIEKEQEIIKSLSHEQQQ